MAMLALDMHAMMYWHSWINAKLWRKIKRSSNNVTFKWWCDSVSRRNDYDLIYLTYANLVLYSNLLLGVSLTS